MNLNFLYVNDTYENITKYSRDELLNLNLKDLISDDELKVTNNLFVKQ